MKKNKISNAVVRRLPKYYRHLGDLERLGKEKISSQQLSAKTGFTASQIRQDLNHFGAFGQQGYGYRIEDLKKAITEIIGLDKHYKAIVIGFGHIGQAIYNYKGFDVEKFDVVGVFDVEEREVNGVKTRHISTMKEFLKKNPVDIAIITVPVDVAQSVCDNFEEGMVKAIWNFAPTDLKVGFNIPIESVHLSESLYSLIFYLWNIDDYK
ncbi:MAG: redox-sensing transcriptional repressor Rex [Tissierellia bacterium]|nr:redox-sensing transcriptional repressor Rex [Tissierellia bacterium]